MAVTLLITGIIVLFALAAFKLTLLRIALNLLPLAIGASYTVYLILSGRVTLAVIVAIVSLYVTCPWWEYLDESVWMKIGLCRDIKLAIEARSRRFIDHTHS